PTGCPFCAGRRGSETNSIATLFPDIAAQWHPTKNGDTTPDKVAVGSHLNVWWKCPKGPDHEWQATITNRTRIGSCCPSSPGKQVSVTNSLATLFPEIAAELHPTRNGHLSPNDIVSGSSKKIWWLCSNSMDHEWQSTVVNRTRVGRGCPYCNSGWTLEAIRNF